MMEPEKPKDLLDWLGISKKPDWTKARPLGTILGGLLVLVVPALIIFAIVAAFAVVGHTIYLSFTGAEKGINLGAGALVAALLGAPFVIWGTVLKQRTVDFQKEGHITDRITSAVEQLGAEKTVKKLVGGATQETTEPNIEVRIGAILSLERIAQDSTRYDNGRDHVRVMEILCAYVRENSNATPPQDFPEPEWEPLSDDASAEERKKRKALREERFGAENLLGIREGGKAQTWAKTLPKPRPDIALALHVLGRRTVDQRLVEAAWPNPPDRHTVWPFDIPCPTLPEPERDRARTIEEIEGFESDLSEWKKELRAYSGYCLDLSGANLQGADLSAGTFSGAKLDHARMEGANLGRTRMEGANLDKAWIMGANLGGAHMEGAKLYDPWMEGANLQSAQMNGAVISRARMDGANLKWAWMEGADLGQPRMEGANLQRARMEGAKLPGARMEGADLRRVRMSRAVLTLARLDRANLHFANMEEADLREARMQKAFLSRANLERSVLRRAQMEGSFLRKARMSAADLSHVQMDENTSLAAANVTSAAVRFTNFSNVPFTADQIKSMFGDASVTRPEGMEKLDKWPDWRLPDRGELGFNNQWNKWQDDPAGYKPPPKPEE